MRTTRSSHTSRMPAIGIEHVVVGDHRLGSAPGRSAAPRLRFRNRFRPRRPFRSSSSSMPGGWRCCAVPGLPVLPVVVLAVGPGSGRRCRRLSVLAVRRWRRRRARGPRGCPCHPVVAALAVVAALVAAVPALLVTATRCAVVPAAILAALGPGPRRRPWPTARRTAPRAGPQPRCRTGRKWRPGRNSGPVCRQRRTGGP